MYKGIECIKLIVSRLILIDSVIIDWSILKDNNNSFNWSADIPLDKKYDAAPLDTSIVAVIISIPHLILHNLVLILVLVLFF